MAKGLGRHRHRIESPSPLGQGSWPMMAQAGEVGEGRGFPVVRTMAPSTPAGQCFASVNLGWDAASDEARLNKEEKSEIRGKDVQMKDTQEARPWGCFQGERRVGTSSPFLTRRKLASTMSSRPGGRLIANVSVTPLSLSSYSDHRAAHHQAHNNIATK